MMLFPKKIYWGIWQWKFSRFCSNHFETDQSKNICTNSFSTRTTVLCNYWMYKMYKRKQIVHMNHFKNGKTEAAFLMCFNTIQCKENSVKIKRFRATDIRAAQKATCLFFVEAPDVSLFLLLGSRNSAHLVLGF